MQHLYSEVRTQGLPLLTAVLGTGDRWILGAQWLVCLAYLEPTGQREPVFKKKKGGEGKRSDGRTDSRSCPLHVHVQTRMHTQPHVHMQLPHTAVTQRLPPPQKGIFSAVLSIPGPTVGLQTPQPAQGTHLP